MVMWQLQRMKSTDRETVECRPHLCQEKGYLLGQGNDFL